MILRTGWGWAQTGQDMQQSHLNKREAQRQEYLMWNAGSPGQGARRYKGLEAATAGRSVRKCRRGQSQQVSPSAGWLGTFPTIQCLKTEPSSEVQGLKDLSRW